MATLEKPPLQTITWILLICMAVTISNMTAMELNQSLEREGRKLFGGYRITPKFCKASKTLPKSDPRSQGPTICMFNHECSQRQGEVVGACMDGFLFGACCQLAGNVDTPLTDSPDDRPLVTSAVAASYESYSTKQNVHVTHSDMEVGDAHASSSSPRPSYTAAPTRPNAQTKPPKKTGVYLPRPTTGAQVFSTDVPTHLAGSSEVTRPTAPGLTRPTASGLTRPTAAGLTRPTATGAHSTTLNQRPTFVQSDITHPGADTVLIENNYQRPSTEGYVQTTNNKGTYAKPQFRPKPTNNKFGTDKYVLVQTITNDKHDGTAKPQASMTENDINSIESIILMLNDTKTGPQYNTDGRPQTTFAYDYNSNNYLSTNKYTGQTSVTKFPTGAYIFASSTTKRPASYESSTTGYGTTASSGFGATAGDTTGPAPYGTSAIDTATGTLLVKGPTLSYNTPPSARPPATSYVFSTTTPKRPPGTTGNYNKLSSTTINTSSGTKKPLRTKKPGNQKVTSKPLSTSYVTGATTPRPPGSPTKRPPSISSYSPNPLGIQSSTYAPLLNTIASSTPAPTVIVLGPYGLLATEAPSPTVHITPKPQLVTSSSTWTNRPAINNKYTPVKLPSYVPNTNIPSYTERPQVYTSLSTSGYGGETISNDFDDPGYYGVSATSTLRPVAPPIIQQTITSSSIYTLVDDTTASSSPYPGYGTYSNVEEGIEQSTLNGEYYTSPNDINNFPPVRNPNLNLTGTFNGGNVEDYDISTPEFVEDELLNDKMGLLVSKIVESLQDSFDNLADTVHENKTAWTTTTGGASSSTRPTTIKRPASSTTGTKKPPQRNPTKKPASSSTRPGTAVTAKPTKPNRRTTKRPGTTVFVNTTKKPANKVTSKKPSTATKPPKKQPTTTTQQYPPQYDENELPEEEDVGEENETAEESTAFFENGRIQCGVRPHVKSGRIVGGKGASFGEWPWQVLVRESTWLGLFTKNKCGGVLISKNYVVTAAHCQPGFLASLVAVFGEFDISGVLEPKQSVTKNIKRVVVHREYDAATFENDLALLELESPIHYDTHIVPICMPSDSADFTGRMATVSGWGRLKYGGGVPSVLQEVQVPIIENSVCQEMFHTAGHNKKILPSFLCAGYANGQKDSCEGDSGGPLVLQRPDGRWELAGTVSHGIKCAAPYLPGVYMRTTYYKPWLETVTGIH